jgi:teichuronic acid biosynthesis glycosyltransferase TuaC
VIRLLVFTRLYPHGVDPMLGVFVENQLKRLLQFGEVSARVVAPVPRVPGWMAPSGYHRKLMGVSYRDVRSGVTVDHPRFLELPGSRLGTLAAPLAMYRAGRIHIDGLLRQGFAFDLISAHLCYPDGVAGVLLGRRYGKPVIITAHGPDLNETARSVIPRRVILWAVRRAVMLITPSQGLKDRAVEIGIDGRHVEVLRNGVDLELFRPGDRAAARARLGLSGLVLLSVGRLVPLKGHHLVIEAMAALPEASFVLVGDGPERRRLLSQSERLGVASRVRFLGKLPHESLPDVYAAADVLVHPSSHEGLGNAPQEAMACGTPVVATDIPGLREVVSSRAAGVLMKERTAGALVAAVRRLLADPPDRTATRAHAVEHFPWDPTIRARLRHFQRAVSKPPPAAYI